LADSQLDVTDALHRTCPLPHSNIHCRRSILPRSSRPALRASSMSRWTTVAAGR